VDPDGRDIVYVGDADGNLATFFSGLAARSSTVRQTLSLYEGEGNPTLRIQHADAGKDPDGSHRAGSFGVTDYSVDYSGHDGEDCSHLTAEQVEEKGTWTIRGGTLTLDSSVTVSLMDKDTVRYATHELGHADQAARTPLQYKHDAAHERAANGKLIPHDQRPAEIVADRYRDRAQKEIGQ
jgi:hypothetical protein